MATAPPLVNVPAPGAPDRPRKQRLSGMDALAELEKLRRKALQPKPSASGSMPAAGAPAAGAPAAGSAAAGSAASRMAGLVSPPRNGEISRELQFTLPKDVFQRAHRVSLTVQLEDQQQQAVDEVRQVHVDIDDPASLNELRLRFNIALNTKA